MFPFRKRTLAGAIAAGFIAASTSAAAQEDVNQIKQQLDELDQKIRVLQRLQEIDKEAAAAKAKESASVSAGKEGFFIRSGDNAYSIRIGGNIQLDSRWYPDKTAALGGTTDQFTLRKVRPVLEGVFYDKIAFRMMPDFGQGQTVLQDAYIEYRHDKAINVRAGKYKPPVGLERLQADSETEFVERSLPTNLVPNRDIGIQLGGSVFSDTLSYQVGVFNGNIDNSTVDADVNDQKDYLGRVFAEPFRNGESFLKGLGVGIAYGYGVQQGFFTSATNNSPNLPTYRTVGQQTFFSYESGAFADGPRRRFSPQFYYYNGPYGLLGEYVASEQDVTRSTNRKRNVASDAWQISAYWVLTGEDASFRNPTPRRPYAIAGPGWGSVELVARYAEQTIDDDAFVGTATTRLANPAASARKASNPGVGVNWYFSRNFKIQVNYDQTSFKGGGTVAQGGDKPDEKAIFTRFQANF
jgi:phosphate-selective porin OprO/OprP